MTLELCFIWRSMNHKVSQLYMIGRLSRKNIPKRWLLLWKLFPVHFSKKLRKERKHRIRRNLPKKLLLRLQRMFMKQWNRWRWGISTMEISNHKMCFLKWINHACCIISRRACFFSMGFSLLTTVWALRIILLKTFLIHMIISKDIKQRKFNAIPNTKISMHLVFCFLT